MGRSENVWAVPSQQEWLVGWALNKCPNDVPAHRVVNQKGLLTGKIHFQGITLMQQLLENEGIVIENNQIVDLE